MAVKTKSKDIKITRLYDAPVKLVWEAWIDPKKAAKWWGPRGFTITTHSKDFRIGGIWHYTMHGPDGVDYPNKTVYFEIEKYKRLVYDHGGNDEQAPLFRVTVNFEEINNKTKMEMTMSLPTPEAAEETRKFVKAAGGNATWDRLAEYLAEDEEKKEIFVINRSFEAPVHLLFDMWSDPNHLANWMPPVGFKMEILSGSIKEGDSVFYKMGNEEFSMYGRSSYQTILRPEKLVFIQQFCTESGEIGRHPGAPIWPKTWMTTAIFTEEEGDTSRVTITSEVIGDASREELEAFVNERGGMTKGWSGSFDKLEEYLLKINSR